MKLLSILVILLTTAVWLNGTYVGAKIAPAAVCKPPAVWDQRIVPASARDI